MKRPIPVLLALLLLTPFLGGCQKVRARVEMKKGNEMYLNESYRQALACECNDADRRFLERRLHEVQQQ